MSVGEGEEIAASTRAVDTEYLVRQSMTAGYQLFSVITPPAYLAFTLSRYGRKSFSFNRLLRATWIGGVGGIVAGGAFGYARYNFSSDEQLRKQRIRVAYDTSRIRLEDHGVIGSVLFAILLPAFFWRRAFTGNLILGGAGIGNSVGMIWHYGRTISGDPPPKSKVV